MDIILIGSGRDELKEFTKVQRIVSTDLDYPGDKYHERIWVIRGLDVHALDCMIDLSYRSQLADNLFCSLKLLTFKRQHRLWVLLCFITIKQV